MCHVCLRTTPDQHGLRIFTSGMARVICSVFVLKLPQPLVFADEPRTVTELPRMIELRIKPGVASDIPRISTVCPAPDGPEGSRSLVRPRFCANHITAFRTSFIRVYGFLALGYEATDCFRDRTSMATSIVTRCQEGQMRISRVV